MKIYARYIKRPLDLLLSLNGIIVLSPVLLITAILVRVKLGSPIIFRQKRPGKDEKIFTLYKFRTMTDERDEEGKLLPDEVRLTRFGKLLRSTSLDELPELFNILKGDMSVIGPRPLLVEYLPYYTEEERHRHDVRPGLTGWAQVNGRNAVSWEQKFDYDLYYIEELSLKNDIKIFFRTIEKVLKKSDVLVGKEIPAGRLDLSRKKEFNMKKIVFFGSIGIAAKVLKEILLQKEVEILGVCCEEKINTWRKEESVYEFAVKKGIKILTYDDIKKLTPDLGISVRYNRIIPKAVIAAFKEGIVNTHGGILPEYRGSYCNINAIINGEKEYGVTLHYIDQGVDSGDIIDIMKIRIEKYHTGFDLYILSESLCFDILEKNIDDLIHCRNQRISQDRLIRDGHECNIYRAENTFLMKDVTGIDDEHEILKKVKAFDSDNHEPAYMRIGNEKVYLRVRF